MPENRTVTVAVRLTPKEYAVWERVAQEKYDANMSHWIRACCRANVANVAKRARKGKRK